VANPDETMKPGRLLSRPDFLAVQKGLRLRGPYFLLEVLDRKQPDQPARVGFTVTKKQGNAVERNRMRRRLREAVRLSAVATGVTFRPGHDYVVVARRDCLNAPFDRIGAALVLRLAGGQGKPGKRNVSARQPAADMHNTNAPGQSPKGAQE